MEKFARIREYVLEILALCLSAAIFTAADGETCAGIVPMRHRAQNISITDFGGVGDGETVNTAAFAAAIGRMKRLGSEGGAMLYIPAGVYLTERFNLTSNMTLYLAKDAVIKATQDTLNWPLADPLPSYGRGRERPGGRYMSFILGDGVHDVIITGENGTVDGQGVVWWNMWRQRTLQYTRPHLIEFMHSSQVIISNLVLKNSPFWNVHPVYCRDVVAQYVTILAPADSPNTDGIDPDSSSNVCIEDSYISTGDDLIAIKSGWDEYGIAYDRPSSNITIRRITGSSPYAGIAVGSETSGGVEHVLAEHINLFNMGVGIHIKTKVGRGGFIRNITVSDIHIKSARRGIKISGDVGDHPDDRFNPNAIPVVEGITMKNITGEKIRQPGLIEGIKKAPFTSICLYNVSLNGSKGQATAWECSDVEGSTVKVSPWPCSELISRQGAGLCSIQT